MKEFKSFFKTVSGGEGDRCRYSTRLDTYGCGCAHDCAYCYAKSLLDFRGLWHPEEPSVASIEKIRRKISKIEPSTVLRLGGMTDCLQPSEAQNKVTKQTIEALNEAGIGYLIVTKSHLIGNDEYLNVLDRRLAHVQISISCTDDEKALQYEKASKVSKRLQALKRLQDKGIDAHLRLSPYIPELIDFDTIKEHVQPKKMLVEFLRVNHWIVRWLSPYVDLLPYSENGGGYKHLPLCLKINEINRIRQAFPDAQLSVCEDVPEHYEYWKTNVNANADDCCNLTFLPNQ